MPSTCPMRWKRWFRWLWVNAPQPAIRDIKKLRFSKGPEFFYAVIYFCRLQQHGGSHLFGLLFAGNLGDDGRSEGDGSSRALARDDVDNSGREEVADDLHELERAQGCGRGALQNDAVPCGEGGGELPCDHQEREVPRDDHPHDAYGLAQDDAQQDQTESSSDSDVSGWDYV